MHHDPTKTCLDRKPISLDMPNEVRLWCNVFGTTEAELRFAVSKVGNSARKVRQYLKGSMSLSNAWE
ncbi:DUF3606 domain-containing protein [Variovorax humicola]|uniref:DUF3606 domain-containing protein n=1 Tax=Variovorax humicola TaxID=1769758 RepID=A0ABU8W5U2_9BURK